MGKLEYWFRFLNIKHFEKKYSGHLVNSFRSCQVRSVQEKVWFPSGAFNGIYQVSCVQRSVWFSVCYHSNDFCKSSHSWNQTRSDASADQHWSAASGDKYKKNPVLDWFLLCRIMITFVEKLIYREESSLNLKRLSLCYKVIVWKRST